MLTVHTFHVLSGWVALSIPVKYRALVERYALFGDAVQESEFRRLSGNGWCSTTEYRTWLQLPGVMVLR